MNVYTTATTSILALVLMASPALGAEDEPQQMRGMRHGMSSMMEDDDMGDMMPMRKRMRDMEQHLESARKAGSRGERRRALHRHMSSMHDMMEMMHGMSMGDDEPGMGMKGQGGAAGGPMGDCEGRADRMMGMMMQRQRRMNQHMNMMQMMMDHMMRHQALEEQDD